MARTDRAWTLGLTSVALFMVTLDALVVVTALPSIHRQLGASLADLEWTINAFTLAFAAGIVTAAAAGDRFGRRRIFSIGLALFTLASAACAIVGMWGALGGLAVASGPLIGGAVTQGLDWHWIFWVNVPIGVAATVLSQVRLAETRGPATRIDLVAVALIGSGATAVVWGLIRAGEFGSDALQVGAALIGGALLILAFLVWEARAREQMLPLRLFRGRSFSAATATGFLMSGSIFGAAFLITQYFQLGLGTAASFTEGFRPALTVVAGLSVLGTLTALALGERRAGIVVDRSLDLAKSA